MTTLLGAIADDFTGATDLAGLLARSGVAVSLRIGVPDDVAAAVSYFLSRDAGFVTGQTLYVCGGTSIGSVVI